MNFLFFKLFVGLKTQITLLSAFDPLLFVSIVVRVKNSISELFHSVLAMP